jgi:predicted NAD-dependent protein-ADP-ribosyltransferase YbiA (DUF1768 family)
MFDAYWLYVSQYRSVQDELLKTGDKDLLYSHAQDSYWGISQMTKEGKNEVGKCLRTVREKLLKKSARQEKRSTLKGEDVPGPSRS